MGYRLGVDLGTTFTSAAVARNGQVEVLQLSDHAAEMPSVVYLGSDGRYLVGEAAVAREIDHPDRVAREFKRRMGDATSIRLGGVPVSAHVATAKLLGSVVATATERQGGAPDRVVVTCPANWGPHRREILKQALEIADVDRGELATEPEAAALHFGAADRLAEGDYVAVYDLGGGTFDAAVLQRHEGELRFLGRPEGLENLGGLDVDAAVVAHVWSLLDLDETTEAGEDDVVRRGMVQLRDECVRAKERLSHDVSASIPVNLPGATSLVRLTRAELEELISPLVDETVACLERSLRRADVPAEKLTSVLLVGGSARIPLVSVRLTERLGRPLPPSPQPKLCVAMGAAMLHPVAPPVAHFPTRRAERPAEGAVEPAAVRASPRTSAPPAEPADDDDTTPRTAASRPARPAVRAWSRAGTYGVASALLLLAALLFAWVVPGEPGPGLSWTRGDSEVGAGEFRVAESLDLSVLGVSLPRTPLERSTASEGFELSASQTLFLTGPVEATLYDEQGNVPYGSIDGTGGPQWLTPDHGGWWRPLVTIPGGAAVLALLFGVAYAESLLRSARSHPGRTAPSEVLGMVGVGAVVGLAVSLLVWASGRVLDGGAVGLVMLCAAAGSGLIPVALGARGRATAAVD